MLATGPVCPRPLPTPVVGLEVGSRKFHPLTLRGWEQKKFPARIVADSACSGLGDNERNRTQGLRERDEKFGLILMWCHLRRAAYIHCITPIELVGICKYSQRCKNEAKSDRKC